MSKFKSEKQRKAVMAKYRKPIKFKKPYKKEHNLLDVYKVVEADPTITDKKTEFTNRVRKLEEQGSTLFVPDFKDPKKKIKLEEEE